MKKFIKLLTCILSLICVFIFTFISVGYFCKPEKIVMYEDLYQTGYLNIYTVRRSINVDTVSAGLNSESTDADITLFGIIPVSKTTVTECDRKYVYAGGDLLGIRIYTEGLLVVGFEDIVTDDGNVNPGKECGLKEGDIITGVNNQKISSGKAFSAVLSLNEGNNIALTVKRNNDIYYYSLKPVFCESENKYRCGLWLKDSTAGIGTLTFTDPETGMFASLGHAICDNDTKSVLTVENGDIFSAVANDCIKGTKGITGQIKGTFTNEDIGDILINNEFGLYGTYSDYNSADDFYPVASVSEIEEGDAQIICTVSSYEKEYYDIEIEKINKSGFNESRSLVIKVTDPDLLEKTGGIIQGMSGSPIIQNGMIVGAVTHVFLNDPTMGYGVFAETMLQTINDNIE